MRLIDADALISRIDFCIKEGLGSIAYTFMHMIDEAPTIEERKTGRWILVNDNNGQHCVCEFCGEWKYHQKQKFCGECGCRMMEVEHADL